MQRSNNEMTSLLPVLLILLASSIALGRDMHVQEKCPPPDAQLQVVTPEQLTAAAIKKVYPDIPVGLGRIEASIPVIVVVEAQGNVICARALQQSHPMLRKPCEDAARKWQFKPFLVGGKPAAIQGSIIFHVNR
jgi:TonB-like protein